MRKVKYKDRLRSISSKGDVVTDEPDANNLSEKLTQKEMDDVHNLVSDRRHQDVLEELHKNAVRHEKAGDKDALKRSLRRIEIYKKSMQK